MKVSPGCSSARNTAWFICEPELGCTLAKLAPNSCLARSMASVLGDVDVLAAAIVALARIALGVLVGHDRALRLEHGAGDDVFRGDQLDFVLLAAELELDGLGDLGIGLGERGGEEFREQRGGWLRRSWGDDLAGIGWVAMARGVITPRGAIPRQIDGRVDTCGAPVVADGCPGERLC